MGWSKSIRWLAFYNPLELFAYGASLRPLVLCCVAWWDVVWWGGVG